jgi:hypothetical protein
MNRLSQYFDESPEQPYGDFYVVEGLFFSACVTRETADYVEAALSRWWVPRWLVFRDRSGSRIRVRTSLIRSVGESTPEQRAADRKIDRARKREEKADRSPWDDDD